MAPEFHDRQLGCINCKEQFIFSGSEQAFYKARELKNEPKRCPNCRIVTLLKRKGIDPQQISEICCAECGALTKVPFTPRGHKPIYCSVCFHARKKVSRKMKTDTKKTKSDCQLTTDVSSQNPKNLSVSE